MYPRVIPWLSHFLCTHSKLLNMHIVFIELCFLLIISPAQFTWWIYPYYSGMLHRHWGNRQSHQCKWSIPEGHYYDVIMGTIASQITSLTIVYSGVYSDADQSKHQSSASLAFVREIHRDGEFPAQMASNAENVSIWWRHHDIGKIDRDQRTTKHTEVRIITVTSQWAWWRLKSPASRLFTRPFIRHKSKEQSKLRVTDLCEGNSPVTGEFPAQTASNAVNVSIWWHHNILWVFRISL